MQAAVITRAGPPEVLRIEQRPAPEPGASEIRVRVVASALNRADLIQRRGGYPAPRGAPQDIPGLEFAGEVEAVGGAVGRWRVGDRVMGIVGGGGHAEYVCVHEREAIPIPEGLSWEDAAAIPEAFLTAHDALRQLGVRAGERVLIHAVGSGVGTAALQLARVTGAITFGTSRTQDKLDRAKAMGLDHALLASGDEWVTEVEALTGGAGVQAVVDLVGGAYAANNLRAMSVRGRALVVGLVAGSGADLDLGLMLRKRLQLRGTVLRTRPIEEKIALARDFSDTVVPLIAAGRVRPIVDQVFQFDDIVEAHRRMEANDSFGKIVLRW